MLDYFLFVLVSFFIGYMIGRAKEDKDMRQLCRSQMERGDYWYDKYMLEVDEDWEPITEDFN